MVKIFPTPKSVIYEEGTLEFKHKFFVDFSHEPDEEYDFGIKRLVEYVKTYIGSELSDKKGEDTTVISFVLDESISKEEYKIEIYEDDIVVKNSGYISAFRAISTLKQILKIKGEINYEKIFSTVTDNGYGRIRTDRLRRF